MEVKFGNYQIRLNEMESARLRLELHKYSQEGSPRGGFYHDLISGAEIFINYGVETILFPKAKP